MKIRLNIQYGDDRSKMVQALANSGYAVWVEEEERRAFQSFKRHYVCFEYDEKEQTA